MSSYYKQQGVGLLEVLIAVLVLSVSLLAIASMHSRSLQYNQSAYVRSQVNILAYDIFDRIRANRANIGSYTLAFDDASPTGTDAASVDLREWLANINRVLPGGEASIGCEAIAGTTIQKCETSIRWTEANIFGDVDEDELDAEARSTFTYTTSI
jgi:type IV pilus assembly protein PilV